MENLNIWQKMSMATDKINKVAKNLKVGVGQSQYKAVGEADVLEAVKPIEIELGIYSYPIKREIVLQDTYTTTSEYKGEMKEKNTIFMRLKTTYRFVNIDKPDEFIDVDTYGDGVDSQDKAPGKAMTYSDKYALLKAYKIETGDDPDQNASQELGKKVEKTEIIGGKYVLKNGKYANKTLQEVFIDSKQYLNWLYENATSFEIKQNILKCFNDNGIVLEQNI